MFGVVMLLSVLVQPLTGLEESSRWTSEDAALYPIKTFRDRLEIGVEGSATEGAKRVTLKKPTARGLST